MANNQLCGTEESANRKLLGELDEVRASGLTIGVSSGYYNPIHYAHIKMLKAAKCLCNYHVVIVNNDYQVGLKGSVAFMNEDDRLEIVSSLKFVDAAILSFDKDRSVSKTLSLIKPDFFFNGGDANFDNCREKDVCDFLGIHMIFGVGGVDKLRSSSELIKNAV